jgi:hypothetical protein
LFVASDSARPLTCADRFGTHRAGLEEVRDTTKTDTFRELIDEIVPG